MALNMCKPAVGEYFLRDKLPHYSSLKVEYWSQELASHPECYYVAYLLEGIANGFRIGFNQDVRCTHVQTVCQLKILQLYQNTYSRKYN